MLHLWIVIMDDKNRVYTHISPIPTRLENVLSSPSTKRKGHCYYTGRPVNLGPDMNRI
jgi:hypothetical protein